MYRINVIAYLLIKYIMIHYIHIKLLLWPAARSIYYIKNKNLFKNLNSVRHDNLQIVYK